MSNRKFNGDTKIILARIDERVDSLKEGMEKGFDDIKDIHKEVFQTLKSHSKKHSVTKTHIKYIIGIGGFTLSTIIFILIKFWR